MKESMLSITPRTVREQNGIRPFQESTLKALKSKNRLITVEAPVGSGKSYIIRRIIEDGTLSERPIILTYPTKILMNAQINALKKEIGNVRHWPEEPELYGEITLFEYSTDALISHLKKHPEVAKLDKSEIINQVLRNHQFSSRHNIVVTTPDVLHLIRRGVYRGSQRLEALLNGAIVVFDEFHLYTGLKNFAPLIAWLADTIAGKVVFLSATPTANEEMEQIWSKYSSTLISFKDSIGGSSDRIFNYPLKLHVEECRYTKTDIMLGQLKKYLPVLSKPTAVIFDSVFRLRHLKPLINKAFNDQFDILEYSGMEKDHLTFKKNTVILGTASIEVGVEMPIKSLITEASYWTSAVQRLGRVGRDCPGEVVLFTRKRLSPFLKDRSVLTRDDLEQNILQSALKESIGTMVSGEMFRGDSYPFLLIDKKNKIPMPYSEALFAMFDIEDDFISNWRKIYEKEKRDNLKSDYGISDEAIKDILLRDKIFPFCGVVSGRLRTEYDNVTTKLTDHELMIQLSKTGKTYYFDL